MEENCMQTSIGTRNEMEEVLGALSGYLETLDEIEVFYSTKRGYLVLRWNSVNRDCYGIDSVKDTEELALYIYGELNERITVETKSDHNLKNMDFDELEFNEAKAITRQFLRVLPEKVRDQISRKLDPDTGLLPFIGNTVESLMG
jgi:hypothetical protein